MSTEEEKQQPFNPDEWAEPIPFEKHKELKFPTEAYPKALKDFVLALQRHTETPVELPGLMALATVSAAVNGKYTVQIGGGFQEPVHIWTCVALASGNRKSSVLDACLKPIKKWEEAQAEAMQEEIGAAKNELANLDAELRNKRARLGKAGSKPGDDEALREDIRELSEQIESTIIPVPPRVWAEDITAEKISELMQQNKGVLSLFSDEGGIFDTIGGRYSRGVPNLDILLKGHSATSSKTDRKSGDPIYLSRPCMTFGIAPQPSVLTSMAKEPAFRGKGFLARFFFASPRSTLGLRSGIPHPIPQEVFDAYHRLITTLLDQPIEFDKESNALVPKVLTLSENAEKFRLEFWKDIEKQMLITGRLYPITDWASKLQGGVNRLAGLLHVVKHADVDPSSVEVDAETMLQAIAIAEVLIEHALATFDLLEWNPVVRGAKRIMEWFQTENLTQFTQRQCHRALIRTFNKVDQAKESLALLRDHCYIWINTNPETGDPRSIIYEVNPLATF